MYQSLNRANIILRLGLAVVFLWFGIDKFFHPDYWLNAWVPTSILHMGQAIHLDGPILIYGTGIFEVLVGISLLTNIFIEAFSLLAAILWIAILFFSSFNEIFIRDIGLIGGLISLWLWPKRRF